MNFFLPTQQKSFLEYRKVFNLFWVELSPPKLKCSFKVEVLTIGTCGCEFLWKYFLADVIMM